MDSRKQEIRRLVSLAEDQGWKVEDTESGHVTFFPPNKAHAQVTTGTTPSCSRALKNLRGQLRRAGLRDERVAKRKEKAAPRYPTPVFEPEEKFVPTPQEPKATTQGACEDAIYLKIKVPERIVETPVEFSDLADIDLLALLRGAQAELLRRAQR